MATKVKMLKLLQEMRGLSELSRLQSAPKRSALYLMQLRTHAARTARPKRRLVIQIDLRDTCELPDPVKITFLPSSTVPAQVTAQAAR